MTALACFIMGFALYVAVDTGVVKMGRLGKLLASDSASSDSDTPLVRLGRIKSLHDRLESVESRMKEKVQVLSKMNDEVQDFAKRLSGEKRSLNEMSNVVLELERSRIEIGQEMARSPSGVVTLQGALADIAKAARKSGVKSEQLAGINWSKRDYLRLVDAFDFQKDGIYLRSGGLDKADEIADAIETAALKEITVVYRNPGKPEKNVSQQRAHVLRNHFRDLLGRKTKVRVARVETERVSPGSVEIWMSQE